MPDAIPLPACDKCGVVKKNGKLSCCGPGGSWLGQCGEKVGENIKYTWGDGMTACAGQALLIRPQTNSTEILLSQSHPDQEKDPNVDVGPGDGGASIAAVSHAHKFDVLAKISVLGVLSFLVFQVLF